LNDTSLYRLRGDGDRNAIFPAPPRSDGLTTDAAIDRAQAIIDNASFTFPELSSHISDLSAGSGRGFGRQPVRNADIGETDQWLVDQRRALPSG